jgi:hypothetical protein
MRHVGLAGIGSCLLFALAGCGGGGQHLYTLAATQGCMQHAGYLARPLANHSLPGSGGNLLVRLRDVKPLLTPSAPQGAVIPNEYVFLVFDKDAASAVATENKAVTLTIRTLNVSGEAVTRAYVEAGVGLAKNVFFYSPTGPLTKGERTKVVACLR